ncbi:unnamed protein product [Ambrosiozyma monospora]|uniref:Unnamed protein product n=1 Tax=Ambrosiozyma monospora TaxID=43982 RepID=A0A9W7DF50_AMBMO|nr:unnamed protein product [Ambrosiozyma monospora]
MGSAASREAPPNHRRARSTPSPSSPIVIQSNGSSTSRSSSQTFRSRRLSSISSSLSRHLRRKSLLNRFRHSSSSQTINQDQEEDRHFTNPFHHQLASLSNNILHNSHSSHPSATSHVYHDESSIQESHSSLQLSDLLHHSDSSLAINSVITNSDRYSIDERDESESVSSVRRNQNFRNDNFRANGHVPPSTREDLIAEQFENIARNLDESLIVQFQTLSNLLQSVTISTLRRLINNFPSDHNEENATGLFDISDYQGTRIDRSSLDENDLSQDRTFSEFMSGLSHENLLHRELGTQILNNQNLSFFRAYRFNNERISLLGMVPVLIVGVVNLNEVHYDHSTTTSNRGSSVHTTPSVANSIVNSSTSSTHETTVGRQRRSSNTRPATNNNQDTDSEEFDDISIISSPSSTGATNDTTTTNNSYSTSGATTSSSTLPDPVNSSYRSWIIIVMTHQYPASDPVLNSISAFIDLLSNYVANGRNGSPNQGDVPNNLDELRGPISRFFPDSPPHLTKKELETKFNEFLFTFTSDASKCDIEPLNLDKTTESPTAFSSSEQQYDTTDGSNTVSISESSSNYSEFISAPQASSWTATTTPPSHHRRLSVTATPPPTAIPTKNNSPSLRPQQISDSTTEKLPYHIFEVGDRCPICLLDYQEEDAGRSLLCTHKFHRECIDEWLLNENTCPICRGKGLPFSAVNSFPGSGSGIAGEATTAGIRIGTRS